MISKGKNKKKPQNKKKKIYIYIYIYEIEIRSLLVKAFKAMVIKVLTELRRMGEHSDIKIINT